MLREEVHVQRLLLTLLELVAKKLSHSWEVSQLV
jgi:hypothetical protein